MKNTINIFSETGCIPHETLWRYRQGNLSAKEKHDVELHLTDCELCSDALAGMAAMESDNVIMELRKSVLNISSPKKVIRFYDFRIIAAAAAVAVFVVFTYFINSTKNENKEIAQLTKPEEKNKEEKINSTAPLTAAEPVSVPKEETTPAEKTETKTSTGMQLHGFSPAQQINSIPPGDKQTEPVSADNAATIPAAADAETKSSADIANAARPAAIAQEETFAKAKTKSSDRNKKTESPQVSYFHELKVAKVPAMAPTEKFDSVPEGIPAPYENQIAAEQEKPIKEMPFVYSKTLKDGIGYYKNNKYQYAIQTFNIILERFPNDINATFYKGLSEMESQNFSDASTLLKKAVTNGDKTFYEEAKFKLAVCYAALRQTKDAKRLFEEIISEKGFYSSKAKVELEKLK